MAAIDKLPRKTFFRFVVELPEKGDVAGMQRILDDYPGHRQELLKGVRPGTDRGHYSAMAYATWLCNFDGYLAARDVVRWLVRQGLPSDIWVAIALDDRESLRAFLQQDPALVNARHPLFNWRIVEYVRLDILHVLIEHGADVSDVWMAIRQGRFDEIRRQIERQPDLIRSAKRTDEDGRTLLLQALANGKDDIACWLIEQGADPNEQDLNGYRPLQLAKHHECTRAEQALLERGAM